MLECISPLSTSRSLATVLIEVRYLRKAQYHWGWDWGPALASTGPYLPIRLEIFAGRMDDVKILPKVRDTLDKADIRVSAEISGSEGKYVLVKVKAPSGGIVEKKVFEVRGERFEGSIALIKPELWWPHTHGGQPRYEFTVELLSGDKVFHLLFSRSSLLTPMKQVIPPQDN